MAPPSNWDLVADKRMLQEQQPLQVAYCTKIIEPEPAADGSVSMDDRKYVINVKQIAKFVVDLGDRVSPTDIEEGMRVGCAPSHSLSSARIQPQHRSFAGQPALAARSATESHL